MIYFNLYEEEISHCRTQRSWLRYNSVDKCFCHTVTAHRVCISESSCKVIAGIFNSTLSSIGCQKANCGLDREHALKSDVASSDSINLFVVVIPFAESANINSSSTLCMQTSGSLQRSCRSNLNISLRLRLGYDLLMLLQLGNWHRKRERYLRFDFLGLPCWQSKF